MTEFYAKAYSNSKPLIEAAQKILLGNFVKWPKIKATIGSKNELAKNSKKYIYIFVYIHVESF